MEIFPGVIGILVSPERYFEQQFPKTRSLGYPFAVVSLFLILSFAAMLLWGERVISLGVPGAALLVLRVSLVFSLVATVLGGYITWLLGSLVIDAILRLWNPPIPTSTGVIARIMGMAHMPLILYGALLLLLELCAGGALLPHVVGQSPAEFVKAVQASGFLRLASQLRLLGYGGLWLIGAIGVRKVSGVDWIGALVSVATPFAVLGALALLFHT